MVKIGFKIFALCTVFFFFAGAGIFMAMTAVVPSAHVDPQVTMVVYPMALENTKIRFNELIQNIISGVLRQKLVFSELEANAFIYQVAQKYKQFPIKEPYIYFLEDTARLRFDISLEDSWRVMVNDLKGKDVDENLRSVLSSNKPTTRISITIDLQILWKFDHPEISVSRVYVGSLPIPFTGFFNQFFGPANKKIADAFARSFTRTQIYIRDVRLENKYLTASIESKATDDFVRRTETMKMKEDNPGMFKFMARGKKSCKIACDDERQKRLQRYMSSLSAKEKLSDEDISEARKVMSEVEGGGAGR